MALSTGAASATSIALINPSFEDPATGTWVPGQDAPYDSVPDGQQSPYPAGWTPASGVDASDNLVERNPTSAEFPGADGNGALPAPALGSQALFNASTFANNCGEMFDLAGGSGAKQPVVLLEPYVAYHFTVAIGRNLTGPFGGFMLSYADARTSVGTNISFPSDQDPAPGTFKDYSVLIYGSDLITGKSGAPKAGDQLEFGFILGPGAYADNCRLDNSLALPEPSTLMMLASGLAGLLAHAWRKRKQAGKVCRIA
jgi:hypothetical protein